MKTIGLLGGMSWESTAEYYRAINTQVRAARGELSSAKILLHSFNFAEIVALQKMDDWKEAAKVLGLAGRGLKAAGADCIAICTNTMHIVAKEVERMSGCPVIDIIERTAFDIKRKNYSRPLLLGTKYTMEHGFYAKRMREFGLDVLVPQSVEERDTIHSIIFEELCMGRVHDTSRLKYIDIIARAKTNGADSVILGCTEIGMLINPGKLLLPGFDSTQIHAKALVDFSLRRESRGFRISDLHLM